MKNLFRRCIVVTLIFYYLNHFFPAGFSYQGHGQTLLLAAACFVLIDVLLKPIIKLIFLPVNFMTLGMFRWLINVFVLFLATSVVAGFNISAFAFDGAALGGVLLTPREVSVFGAYVVFSFLVVLSEGIIYWLWE